MSITDGTILKLVATLTWTDAEVNQNVFNAVITGGAGPWDEEDVLDDALDWLGTMYANINTAWNQNLTGSHLTLYKYDSIDDDWDEVGQHNWTFVPASTEHALPRGVAALINAKTTDPDVSGKKYLGGTTEAQGSGGIWGGATLTALANFADDWGSPFSGFETSALWTPVIWSVVGTVAKALSEEYIIPTIAAYQRRRKQGVGI